MADVAEPEEKQEPGKSSAGAAVNPEAKAHWKSGNSFFEESKFAEAVKEYNAAIAIDSKYADAYFNRALTERVMKVDFRPQSRQRYS